MHAYAMSAHTSNEAYMMTWNQRHKKKKKTALEGKKAHSVSGLYVWTLSSAMPCFPTIKPDAVGYLDMKDARKKTH